MSITREQYMQEKKKKRGEKPRWLFILHWTFTVVVVLPVLLMAVAVLVIWLAKPVMDSTDVIYPAPPEIVEISVSGIVVNEEGEHLRYDKVDVRVRTMGAYSGFGAGPFEESSGANSIPVDSRFSGTVYVTSRPNGCLRVHVEMEGYEKHKFEFGLQNVEWGADITVKVTADENGIISEAAIVPTEIKPTLAPEPVLRPTCQLQTN
jgi:hypothetical protein